MKTPKYICEGCKSHFYADRETDDFEIGGNYYCSYCYPKVKFCGICGKLKIFKRKVKTDIGICEECRLKRNAYPNVWLTLRFRTFEKDNFTCRYCGRSPLREKMIVLHCDHIIPRAQGGRDMMDNLVTSCAECNQGKTDILLSEYNINLVKFRD